MLSRDLSSDILPPHATILARDVLLVVLPTTDPANPILDRAGIAPPYGTVAVSTGGRAHCIAAIRVRADEIDDMLWAIGGLPHSMSTGAAEQCGTGSDIMDVADELDPQSLVKLLSFLLGFCRTAFGLAHDAAFVAACTRLADRCSQDCGEVETVARAGQNWMIVSGMQAAKTSATLGSSLYVLGATSVQHCRAALSAPPATLQAILPVNTGDRILAVGTIVVGWTVRPASLPLLDVLRPATGGIASRARHQACLRALAPVDPIFSAMLREAMVLVPAAPLRHQDPASPLGAALDVVLPDGEGSLLLRGWLRDPLQLITGAELRTPAGNATIDLGQLHRVRRPDLDSRFNQAAFRDDQVRLGFIVRVPDPSAGLCAQPTLSLRLGSNAVVDVIAPLRHLPPGKARTFVLSCLAPEDVTPALMDDCLAPTAAALSRAMLAAPRDPEIVRIGAILRKPAISIIVPLYRNLGFLRFQVAALAEKAVSDHAELIYVLDSPEQRGEAEHLLRGLYALYRLPMTLVVMPGNLGYSAANNSGAIEARAPVLLLLNSDVVPCTPGWLAPLRAALDGKGVGAVGPKLLFDDGSIQHAGLFFERDADGTWFNAHYHKGMPRHWPGALRPRHVPAVTGAALLVRKALFESVGGVCEDYIIGDYEDSDLCLRIRQAGASIAYVPDSELYHFERRSIRLHPGYTRTLASLYNRRLHHRRWDTDMTAIMARPANRRAAVVPA